MKKFLLIVLAVLGLVTFSISTHADGYIYHIYESYKSWLMDDDKD